MKAHTPLFLCHKNIAIHFLHQLLANIQAQTVSCMAVNIVSPVKALKDSTCITLLNIGAGIF